VIAMRIVTLVLLSAALSCSLSGNLLAEPTQVSTKGTIPTAEREFVASINGYEKAEILGQFGAPSKQDDVKTASGKVIASIWQYHNLNTDEKGIYYQTTELDFINDKVVMVVFMNNDGTDIPADAATVPPPTVIPDM
jgi:hypothetical protein